MIDRTSKTIEAYAPVEVGEVLAQVRQRARVVRLEREPPAQDDAAWTLHSGFGEVWSSAIFHSIDTYPNTQNKPKKERTRELGGGAEADVEGDGAALGEATQHDLLRGHARLHLPLDDLVTSCMGIDKDHVMIGFV